jgi:hypothetical protein
VVRRELLQLHWLARVSDAQACNLNLLRGHDDPAAFLHVRKERPHSISVYHVGQVLQDDEVSLGVDFLQKLH